MEVKTDREKPGSLMPYLSSYISFNWKLLNFMLCVENHPGFVQVTTVVVLPIKRIQMHFKLMHLEFKETY